MRIKTITTYLIVFLLGITSTISDPAFAQTDESRVKAMWVHTLMSYIKWDKNNNSKDKMICTRGLDRTYHFLKEIQKEKKTNYKLMETGINDDLDECKLLYIASSERDNISGILSSIEKKNILTVSDIKGFAQEGGMIELSHKGDVVKLKINIKSAKNSNIIINSDLLAVSTVIKQ